MKKVLLIAFVALFSFNNATAQLPDGSVAPDFTLTDLNGTTHNLYNLLDQGYTVFLDFLQYGVLRVGAIILVEL